MTRCREDLTTFVQNHGCLSLKEASKTTAAVVSQFLFAPLWVTAPLLVLQINTLPSAHTRRVIHCDIKPNNIACSPDSKLNAPVVIDWGLVITTGAPDRSRSGGLKQGFSLPLIHPTPSRAPPELEPEVQIVELHRLTNTGCGRATKHGRGEVVGWLVVSGAYQPC